MIQLDPLPAIPKVSLVIPCYNEAGHITECLASIAMADRSGMQLSVLVCDGRSSDSTRSEIEVFARRHPFVQLIDNPERTTPFALNRGLQHVPFDVGIILGAHAEVHPDFLQENLRVLREVEGCGCSGGSIESVYESATAARIGAAMSHPFGVGSAHFRTGVRSGSVDTVAFGAYRKEVFETVGHFDVELDRNQDDEFNYRVVRAGFVIHLDPAIKCRYHVRGSYMKLFRQYFQYGFWKVVVNRKHRTITTFRQVVPALFILWCIGGTLLALLLHNMHVLVAIGLGMLLYVTVALGMAFRAAKAPKDVLGVFAAFLVLHVAYGLGYVKAFFTHAVFGMPPGKRSRAITR